MDSNFVYDICRLIRLDNFSRRGKIKLLIRVDRARNMIASIAKKRDLMHKTITIKKGERSGKKMVVWVKKNKPEGRKGRMSIREIKVKDISPRKPSYYDEKIVNGSKVQLTINDGVAEFTVDGRHRKQGRQERDKDGVTKLLAARSMFLDACKKIPDNSLVFCSVDTDSSRYDEVEKKQRVYEGWGFGKPVFGKNQATLVINGKPHPVDKEWFIERKRKLQKRKLVSEEVRDSRGFNIYGQNWDD